MMNIHEARIIADRYLEGLRSSCPVAIEFNYEISEEHPIGYVFFYNSIEFWRTRNFSASLAGNGPVLVLRDTGDVVILPSSQSVKRSLKELE